MSDAAPAVLSRVLAAKAGAVVTGVDLNAGLIELTQRLLGELRAGHRLHGSV